LAIDDFLGWSGFPDFPPPLPHFPELADAYDWLPGRSVFKDFEFIGGQLEFGWLAVEIRLYMGRLNQVRARGV